MRLGTKRYHLFCFPDASFLLFFLGAAWEVVFCLLMEFRRLSGTFVRRPFLWTIKSYIPPRVAKNLTMIEIIKVDLVLKLRCCLVVRFLWMWCRKISRDPLLVAREGRWATSSCTECAPTLENLHWMQFSNIFLEKTAGKYHHEHFFPLAKRFYSDVTHFQHNSN